MKILKEECQIIQEKYTQYNDSDGWLPEDIELHKNTDWKSRNYKDLDVDDSYIGKAHLYGDKYNKDIVKQVEFHKFLRANPIYPPYYAPVENPFGKGTVGPMYDGAEHKTYKVHNRYETQELYDMMFD